MYLDKNFPQKIALYSSRVKLSISGLEEEHQNHIPSSTEWFEMLQRKYVKNV